MLWQVGVTTCPQRGDALLPATLKSLAAAGFDRPRLFIDDASPHVEQRFRSFNLEMTVRNPKIGAYANWSLGLAELFLRNPSADRYAVFQDDLVMCRNVRQYLEQATFPDHAYLNLFTFMDSEEAIKGRPPGFHPSPDYRPYRNRRDIVRQHGRGALALVFDRQGVVTLLTHWHMVKKVMDPRPQFSSRRIDGGIVEAMNDAGWKEWVHNPSLVQHTGVQSTIQTVARENPRKKIQQTTRFKRWNIRANTFPGEEFDALQLLPGAVEVDSCLATESSAPSP